MSLDVAWNCGGHLVVFPRMRIARPLLLLTLLLLPPLAMADAADLTRAYAAGELEAETHGIPLQVRSTTGEEARSAEVVGLLRTPFAEVAALLTDPAAWCQFVPLIQNVKACVHADSGRQLAFHAGPKGFAHPEDAYRFEYSFQVVARRDDYIDVRLDAARGPLGTRDHHLRVEAIPVPEGTFLQVRSGYESSRRSRFLTGLYLATVGRDKVGFSVVGRAADGGPRLVGGIRGVVERNAMRWYLALQAYLASAEGPPRERFLRGARRWYDLTERFARQLRELERDEYMAAKSREYALQRQLQAEIAATERANRGVDS